MSSSARGGEVGGGVKVCLGSIGGQAGTSCVRELTGCGLPPDI